MVLRRPGPNDKLAYFTKRTYDKGKIMVWRFEGEELANIEYTCPHCDKTGEKQQPFVREKMAVKDPKTGKSKKKDVFRVVCDFCSQPIDLEKWVKKGPGKKKAD